MAEIVTGNYLILFKDQDDKGKFLFWDIKVATAKRGGKPPPESAARILESQALNFVKQSLGKNKCCSPMGTMLSIFKSKVWLAP